MKLRRKRKNKFNKISLQNTYEIKAKQKDMFKKITKKTKINKWKNKISIKQNISRGINDFYGIIIIVG